MNTASPAAIRVTAQIKRNLHKSHPELTVKYTNRGCITIKTPYPLSEEHLNEALISAVDAAGYTLTLRPEREGNVRFVGAIRNAADRLAGGVMVVGKPTTNTQEVFLTLKE